MFYGFEEGIMAIVGFQGGIVFVGEMERANSANCWPFVCAFGFTIVLWFAGWRWPL